jgi:uncharacterized protein YqjF (DUF2071 family)
MERASGDANHLTPEDHEVAQNENQAVRVEDLIPIENIQQHYDFEALLFERMRSLIANHLHYTYQSGHLRWPKTRLEIQQAHNEVVRNNFPQATNL